MPEAIQVLKSDLPAAIRANKNTEGSDDDIGQFIYVGAEASQLSSKLINPKTQAVEQSFASDFVNGMAIMALASNGKIDAGAFDKILRSTDRSILGQMGTAAGAEALMSLVVALKGKNVTSALAALPNLFNGT